MPNRFADRGDTPEYNTADATLWHVEAIGGTRQGATTLGDDVIRGAAAPPSKVRTTTATRRTRRVPRSPRRGASRKRFVLGLAG